MAKFDFSEEAELTNAELAGELAKLAPLTATQIQELLPKREDKARLAQLIEIVGGATSQNKKVAALTDNMSELGGVVVKLLGKYLNC